MKIDFESKRQGEDRKYTYYYFPGSWVVYITQAVVEGVTNIVAVAITVVVTILVLLGGLWLAYTYLPVNVFYIVLTVLLADILLGIVLRAVFLRR